MRVKFRLVRNRPKGSGYPNRFDPSNVSEFQLLVEAHATVPCSYYGDGTRHTGYGETIEAALADLRKCIMQALVGDYEPDLAVINAIEVQE